MSTYYSIVFANINSATVERLSVGLILGDETNLLYRYSEAKLRWARHGMNPGGYALLHGTVTNIDPVKQKSVLTFSYLDYLHRYSNNIIGFSPPKNIAAPCNDEWFEKLFHAYVEKRGSGAKPPVKREASLQRELKRRLYPEIKDRVAFQYELTPQTYGLPCPITVPFFGLNGTPISGHIVDLDQKRATEREICVVKTLHDAMSGHHFLIHSAATDDEAKERLKFAGTDYIDFVPLSETDRIVDYMVRNDVRPPQ